MVLIKQIRKGVLLFVVLITTSALSVDGQKVEKVILKEVQAMWKDAVLLPLDMESGKVTDLEGFHGGDQVYQVSDSSEIIIAYVLLTSAMGRHDAFDYFLIFSETLEILLVRVSIYRSAHGSAICNKRWLRQFVGYKGGELIYGKDVQAVTGATISGASIVEDVQRAQQFMVALKKIPAIGGF